MSLEACELVDLIEIISRSERETFEFGLRLAKHLLGGDVIAMRGGLGSGKTVLACGILRGLGIAGAIQSPSFIMVATYHGRSIVNHIDLYRVERGSDFESLGLEEKLYSNEISLIEWAEKIDGLLPAGTIYIDITSLPLENMRLIKAYPKDEDAKPKLFDFAMDILRGETDACSRH